MLSYPLTNFEIQKYYRKEPKFNGVYSRNNLPIVKEWAYIISLDEYESIGNYWIVLYVNAENVTFFDSFEVEHILKEIIIGNQNVITNIYIIQGYNSIMC